MSTTMSKKTACDATYIITTQCGCKYKLQNQDYTLIKKCSNYYHNDNVLENKITIQKEDN